jgi:hypothetical protein
MPVNSNLFSPCVGRDPNGDGCGAARPAKNFETSVFHRISQKQTLETTVGRAPASEHLPNFKL